MEVPLVSGSRLTCIACITCIEVSTCTEARGEGGRGSRPLLGGRNPKFGHSRPQTCGEIPECPHQRGDAKVHPRQGALKVIEIRSNVTLKEASAEILAYLKKRKEAETFDIANDLRLDLDLTVKALKQLWEKGKVA
jgi:hypothetical protein